MYDPVTRITLDADKCGVVNISDDNGYIVYSGTLSLNTEYSITGYSLSWDFEFIEGNWEYVYFIRVFRNSTTYGTDVTYTSLGIDVDCDY